jgi:cytochrome bd ubiquinol oxidase subunit II
MSRQALETGLLVMLGAGLTVYVLLGGADFGGGVWDLVAAGPTGPRQRRLIEEAIGPVWEANHVWLIFVLTGLFAAFPRAFAILGVALYLPFGLAIAGIVFRGAAFAFRVHGDPSSAWVRTWTRTFGIASLVTPFVLGATAGAIASGRLDPDPDSPLLAAWTSPFSLVLGGLMVAMCAFLAATYLAVEAVQRDATDLEELFRARALGAGVTAGGLALAALLLARSEAPVIWHGMLDRGWPLVIASAAGGLGALLMLRARRYGAARLAAAAAVSAVIAGWGVSQAPELIVGTITVHEAAAPAASLRPLFIGYLVGAALIVPSLLLLLRVFKSGRDPTSISP